jgi:hypothetical protein
MGFAAGPVSGVALMVMGFILDAQAFRRKRRGQLCRNDIVHYHDAWINDVDAPRSITPSRAFALCQVLQVTSPHPHNRNDENEFAAV